MRNAEKVARILYTATSPLIDLALTLMIDPFFGWIPEDVNKNEKKKIEELYERAIEGDGLLYAGEENNPPYIILRGTEKYSVLVFLNEEYENYLVRWKNAREAIKEKTKAELINMYVNVVKRIIEKDEEMQKLNAEEIAKYLINSRKEELWKKAQEYLPIMAEKKDFKEMLEKYMDISRDVHDRIIEPVWNDIFIHLDFVFGREPTKKEKEAMNKAPFYLVGKKTWAKFYVFDVYSFGDYKKMWKSYKEQLKGIFEEAVRDAREALGANIKLEFPNFDKLIDPLFED